jgi:DNA-binding beta-propeller fold protein YncE
MQDGTGSSAQFYNPYGVCFDPGTGSVYIADAYNNVIRKLSNGMVTTVAGTGDSGDLDGPALTAQFNTPTGVFFKNGYLYICDDFNNKIKRMDSSGQVETIAGSGASGFADGPALSAAFHEPKSIVVDDAGTVYVADYENHRVRRIMNGMVTTVAGTGVAGDSFGVATNSNLYRPRDLCLGPDGSVYIAVLGNNRIKRLTPGGMLELVAGSGDSGWQDGTGSAAQFSSPVAIDWLDQNTLLVLDAASPRLRKVTLDGNVTTLAGNGNSGFQDGLPMDAEFSLPQDICLDWDCNVFVGDRNNNRIREIRHDGTCTLGVEELFSSSDFSLTLFPNPVGSHVTVQWKNRPTGKMTIEVFDARGALVLAPATSLLNSVDINVASLASGVYEVRAIIGSAVRHGRILKN